MKAIVLAALTFVKYAVVCLLPITSTNCPWYGQFGLILPFPFPFAYSILPQLPTFAVFLFLFFLPFLLLFLISLTQTTAELCVAFFKHMQIWICNVVLNVYVRLVLVRYIWLLVVCFCALLSFATKSPFARSDDAAWSVFACVPNLSQDNQTHFVGLDEWDHQYTTHLRSNTHFEHIFNLTIYSN